MDKKNLIHSAVYGIARKEGKILFIRRCRTGYKDGFYTLPSGHIEQDELPTEAMIRELKEEVGLSCEVAGLLPVHVMYRIADSGRTYVDYFFEIKKYEGKERNREPNKCDQMTWLDFENDSFDLLNGVKIALGLINEKIPISEIRENR